MDRVIHQTRTIKSGIPEGELILPLTFNGELKHITIGSVKIIVATVNDLFDIKQNSTLGSREPDIIILPQLVNIVIPSYPSGALYQRLRYLQPEQTITPIADNIKTETSILEGIHQIIHYQYNRSNNKYESDFEQMGLLCPSNSNLVLPTFGTNNQLSFYEVASRIFYSLITSLSSESSSLKKLSNIIIATKFDDSETNEMQNYSSVRVIKHLFNLINIYQLTTNEPTCIICFDMKRNTILPCGHRITCTRCLFDIMRNQGTCPICHAVIAHSYPCYTVKDASTFTCGHTIKSGSIYIPCGHHNATCAECDQHYNTIHQCPVCQQPIITVMKLYQ